jgi:hypothetical protein
VVDAGAGVGAGAAACWVGEAKMADLGRELTGVDADDVLLAKGLLRLCAEPLPEKDMAENRHELDNTMLKLSR